MPVDSKLSQLLQGFPIADTDLFYSDQLGASVKQPASAFFTYMMSKGVSVFGPTSKLIADLQLYISPTGSDSNSGTSPASPFLTIQHAFNLLEFIDLNGFVCYINLAPGTYPGAVAGNFFSSSVGANANTAQGGYVQIVGDNVTPSNCVIVSGGGTLQGCFFAIGAVYGQFQGVFLTGLRLNNNVGPTVSADPAIFNGVGEAQARFVLGTNDALFNGLIEVANCGNNQPIFSGNVTDNPPNGGIAVVNILANLFTNNPKAIFEPLSAGHIVNVQADYFIIGGTLTCQDAIIFVSDNNTRIDMFPSVFRLGAGGGFVGKQYHIKGKDVTTGFTALNALSLFSIGSPGVVSEGFVNDSNNTGMVQFPGATGWPAQTTQTANYTHAIGDRTLIFNGTGSITLTLLSATTWPGLELWVKNIAAFTVVSASANVIPQVGGAATTAILAATAGKFALLKSNGTNWEIIASN